MLKQANGEDVECRDIKKDADPEPPELPLPKFKRVSNDISYCVDVECKRTRLSPLDECFENLGTEECLVVQGNVEASSAKVLAVGANMGINEMTSKQHVESQKKLPPATVRGKARTHKISTKLTAEVAEDRGSRHTMEDAWVILPEAWLGAPGKLRFAHFAIYDGHGGRHAAEYARAHLHANILSAGLPRESMDIKGVKQAIIEGFKTTDEALLQESFAGGWQDGATAVCVWVLGQMVFVANVGDAKAVLARVSTKEERRGSVECNVLSNVKEDLKGLIVSREHKAIFPQERARIQKAGGFVEGNGRLLGRLEVSRAFGDRNFKKAGVIAVPDVHVFELTERERFLVLGCDGLWGVFGPSDAVEFVAGLLKMFRWEKPDGYFYMRYSLEGVTVGMACKRLVREAVRERKCKDNCTAIVINFDHLQTNVVGGKLGVDSLQTH